MAFIDIPGWPLSYPIVGGQNVAPALSTGSRTIDDTNEKVAWVLRMPKDGVINRVGFLVGTVTQAPTNGLAVSLQDLDASGNPDGTPDQSRVVPVGDISADTWVETGLLTDDGTDTGVKRTVTQGQELAIVVGFESFAASDSLAINLGSANIWWPFQSPFQPINMHFTTAWGTRNSSAAHIIAVQYEEGSEWVPIYGCLPVNGTSALSLTASSNPDEQGMNFTCPVAMRARGIVFHGYFQNNAATATLRLTQGNATELATATITDPDRLLGLNTNGVFYSPFTAGADTVELEGGTSYRVSVEATGTGMVRLHGYTFPSVSYRSAMPWGDDPVGTQRVNGGSTWTQLVTTQFAIGLLIDAIDPVKAGSSAPGMLRNLAPFMRSFLR